jgi:perosamine synthetase
MWVRLRLDVGWRDLFSGFVYCILHRKRLPVLQSVQQSWNGNANFLVTLSVRSAFDLTLRALQLPHGSEVLLTALTVPDMVRIVESHGLVPVPVDIDENGEINVDSLNQAITSKSRMIVVAHLFGGRIALDDVLSMARQRNLIVVEDFAQSFCRIGDCGHPESDLAMFSFGPIKTASALGGGVVRVRSQELSHRMAKLLAGDPIQSTLSFARRLFRFSALKFVSGVRSASVVQFCVERLGYDFDTLANSVTRRFAGSNLLAQLRQQPSTPLLRLLPRRWQTYDFIRIERRREMGQRLDAKIGRSHGPLHSYWVYPVTVDAPSALRDRLRSAGFDATCLARMTVVSAVDELRIPVTARRNKERIVVLPWYPEMPDAAVDMMAELIEPSDSTKDSSSKRLNVN